MTTLTADDAVGAALRDVKGLVEFRDRDGNLLGFFAPPDQAEQFLYQTAMERFDPEEIRRIKESEGGMRGRTTKEVLEYLRSLVAS